MLGVRLTRSDQGVAVLLPLFIRDVLRLEKKNSRKGEQKNIVTEHF